jgi:prepilin-type N-terminal cleavage/methylation domain-containing protein
MYIKPHTRHGFTLVEVMVAAAISSLMMLVLASFTSFGAHSCAALANYADLETRSRSTLDRMTQQIRQCRGLISSTSTSLVFKKADGSLLEFSYDPNARTLICVTGGTSTVLLTGCDYFNFDLFQRNPVAGTYDVYPMAIPGTCKLIQLTWICSRTLLGARINTESVQSAKIVIRKQG